MPRLGSSVLGIMLVSIASLLNSVSASEIAGSASATAAQEQSPGESSTLFASLLASLSGSPAVQPAAKSETGPSTETRLAAQKALAASVSGDASVPVNLGGIQTQAEAALQNWQKELSNRLEDKGIKLQEPLRLLVRPGDGKIVVQGDHPRKTDIETVLNEDQPLADSIRGISSMFDLLRAAEQHSQFSRAYEEDPVSAVETFSYLFDEQSSWPVELRIDDYGGQVMS